MDCRETQAHVHEYLHNSLTPAEEAEITNHIAHCDYCENHYDIEVLVNTAVQEACAGDIPPAEVVERILQQIRSLDAAGHR